MDDTRTPWQIERDERDAQATELSRLMAEGRAAIPGIRIQEQEVTGRLYRMLKAGNLTQADWDDYVRQMHRENRVHTP